VPFNESMEVISETDTHRAQPLSEFTNTRIAGRPGQRKEWRGGRDGGRSAGERAGLLGLLLVELVEERLEDQEFLRPAVLCGLLELLGDVGECEH